MSKDLIVIKQLPVIEERLQGISKEIEKQTSEVLAMAVTEETVKQIKKHRTQLTKSFKELEDKRKAVKAAVMEPYDAFEQVYKKYVTDIFKPADTKLKMRIDEVENALLDNKRKEVEIYFAETATTKNIDFLTFDMLKLKVLLSDSIKKLKEQVEDDLNKVAGDIAVIGTMEFPEEILVEYKQNLDLTKSVLMVKERRERFAAELQRKAEREEPQIAAESIEPVVPIPDEPKVEVAPEQPVPAKEVSPAAYQVYPVITITVQVHSAEEVMAITEICRARRFAYTIS